MGLNLMVISDMLAPKITLVLWNTTVIKKKKKKEKA